MEEIMNKFFRNSVISHIFFLFAPILVIPFFSCSALTADSSSSSVSFTFSGEFVQNERGGYHLVPRLMKQAQKIFMSKSRS